MDEAMTPQCEPPRHLLVVRTDHLGDMLLTLPVVRAVKMVYPACRISVLASAMNAAAAQHHPDVGHVEVDPREAKHSGLRGIGGLARQIRRLGCDVAVVAHPTPRLAAALWLARVPIRIGSGYRAYSILFNRRVYEHRSRPPLRHEAVYNLHLLRPLGIANDEPAPVPWRVDAPETAAVERLLDNCGVSNAALFAIHPGNAGSALNWAPDTYAALGKRLLAPSARIVVTGGEGERRLTAAVARAIGTGAVDLGGKLTLPQLAALLRRCALYVGSSTGPTHLAAAVGAPVVALFSPLRSNAPERWRPLGERVRVLQPTVPVVCPKCLGDRCPYYHCMERHLAIDAVERAARELLAAKGNPG